MVDDFDSIRSGVLKAKERLFAARKEASFEEEVIRGYQERCSHMNVKAHPEFRTFVLCCVCDKMIPTI